MPPEGKRQQGEMQPFPTNQPDTKCITYVQLQPFVPLASVSMIQNKSYTFWRARGQSLGEKEKKNETKGRKKSRQHFPWISCIPYIVYHLTIGNAPIQLCVIYSLLHLHKSWRTLVIHSLCFLFCFVFNIIHLDNYSCKQEKKYHTLLLLNFIVQSSASLIYLYVLTEEENDCLKNKIISFILSVLAINVIYWFIFNTKYLYISIYINIIHI